MNLYNDPLRPVLKENMSTCCGIMIERLVKPAQFIEDLLKRGMKFLRRGIGTLMIILLPNRTPTNILLFVSLHLDMVGEMGMGNQSSYS